MEQTSADKQFMIECLSEAVITMLIEDYDYTLPHAMDILYSSSTYQKLENDKTGLYYQSAVYIYDMLNEELKSKQIAI